MVAAIVNRSARGVVGFAARLSMSFACFGGMGDCTGVLLAPGAFLLRTPDQGASLILPHRRAAVDLGGPLSILPRAVWSRLARPFAGGVWIWRV